MTALLATICKSVSVSINKQTNDRRVANLNPQTDATSGTGKLPGENVAHCEMRPDNIQNNINDYYCVKVNILIRPQ